MTDMVMEAAPEDVPLAAVGLAATAQVGASLRAGREAMGLDVAEMARQLRLGQRQVEAIESGDLSGLPGKTFVRGFVRNYARAVNLESAPLLALLDKVSELDVPHLDLPESTHVTMPGQGRAFNKDQLTVAAGLVLVLGAVAAYFFLPDQFWVQKPTTVAPQMETQPVTPPASSEPLFPPAGNQEAVTSEAQVPPATAPAGEGKPATPETQPAAAPVPAQTPAPPPAAPAAAAPSAVAVPAASGANAITASFSFARDSWIEVRDKDNNLIVSRLHLAGSSRDISGAAPLSIVVGNASHVKLQYKGQPVALQPNAESDVARLTLQ